MILQPGDLVLTASDSWTTRMIRRFTPRRRRKLPVWASHSALVGEPGPVEEATLVHARVRVLEEPLIERYRPDRDGLSVYRLIDLTWDERERVVRKAREWLGAPYGFWRIGFHAIDYALGGRYVARRLARMDNYPICSWHSARAYKDAVDYDFGVSYREAAPHHLWRWVMLGGREEWYTVVSPRQWKTVEAP